MLRRPSLSLVSVGVWLLRRLPPPLAFFVVAAALKQGLGLLLLLARGRLRYITRLSRERESSVTRYIKAKDDFEVMLPASAGGFGVLFGKAPRPPPALLLGFFVPRGGFGFVARGYRTPPHSLTDGYRDARG